MMFIYTETESLWTFKLRLMAVKEKQVSGNFPGWIASHLGAKSYHVRFLQVQLAPYCLIRNKQHLKMEWRSEISERWIRPPASLWRPCSVDQYLRYLTPDHSSAQISLKPFVKIGRVYRGGLDGVTRACMFHDIVNVFGLTLKIYSFKIHIIILCTSLKKTYMLCQIVKKSTPDGNP